MWQPIETAPKDDKWIIVGWLPNGVVEETAYTQWRGDHWSGWLTPTHWMPQTVGRD